MTKPLVQNASSSKQVREAGKEEKKRQFNAVEDIRVVLSTRHGRRFIWGLLEHCGVFRTVFEPNSKMAYNSGMQDVGHFVLGEIMKAQPEAYITMMMEAKEEEA